MGRRQMLLLLTNRYPFAPGEEYLHTEIPFLAEEFHEVAILPLMRVSGSTHSRELPSNVTLVDVTMSHGWRTRVETMVRGPLRRSSPSDASTLAARAYERYFTARTQRLAQKVAPAVQQIIQSSGAEVSVMYAYWFYVTTSVAIELRREIPALEDVPIVARGHGYDVNEAASPVKYLPQRRHLLAAVEALHPTADTITQRLQREWPMFASKMSTRRLGVVPAAPASRTNSGPLRILSCSSLSPIKRLDLMVAAVAECRRRGLDVTWTHIGSGTRQQEALLARAARRAGLGSAFVRTGQLDNAEVYRVLASGDHTLFLNTSSSESVSFSMSEAMSAGLPVVGTDVVGTHEILTDGINGRLVSSDPSPANLADAIEWIATRSPEDYQDMCTASRHTAERLLDPRAEYRRFAADLRKLGRTDGG